MPTLECDLRIKQILADRFGVKKKRSGGIPGFGDQKKVRSSSTSLTVTDIIVLKGGLKTQPESMRHLQEAIYWSDTSVTHLPPPLVHRIEWTMLALRFNQP